MGKRLYIEKLRWGTTEGDLRAMFEPFGIVKSAHVIFDRSESRSSGFGFVEMADDHEAERAIEALNGTEVNGRTLTVKEAKPRADRGGRTRFGGT